MYERFLKLNPTPQLRMEAFTSILMPDMKGLSLLSMDPEKAYTKKELYNQFLEFYGFKPPVTIEGLWSYYNGVPSKGPSWSLEAIGVVAKWKVKEGKDYITAYQKTDAGRDFGDPIVAIGTYAVNELSKMNARYCSLWRILGGAHTSGEVRRGFTVYKIIKLLAENPETKFTRTEICEGLKLAYETSVPRILNSLGEAGVIDYFSPSREVKGKKQRGWAQYRLVKELDDPEKIIEEARKQMPWFCGPTAFRKVVEYIRKNPNGTFECNKLSEELKIGRPIASRCLSFLSKSGYLSYELKGGEIQTIVKANEKTKFLWELFKPVERVAYKLNPNDSEFREMLEYYQNHKDEWRDAVKKQLEIYDKERSNIGLKGGEEVREKILLVLSQYPEGMKLSHIHEEVNKISERRLTTKTIGYQLGNLEREGSVRKIKRGYYALRGSLNKSFLVISN